MAAVTVRVVGLDGLRARLTPDLDRGALASLLRDAALVAERVARGRAPRDTAALARSITTEAKPTVARVFTTLAYAAVMEEGRRPGAKPPPPEALEGWMRRHRMDPRAAWALAKAIGRRGIKGRFFFRAAVEAADKALPELLRRAGAQIGRQWTS